MNGISHFVSSHYGTIIVYYSGIFNEMIGLLPACTFHTIPKSRATTRQPRRTLPRRPRTPNALIGGLRPQPVRAGTPARRVSPQRG